MFVVMGTTRGDDLIGSTKNPLFASASREACEAKMAQITKERDDWLATHPVAPWEECAIYTRFDIVETAFSGELEKAIEILQTTVAIHRDTSYLWRHRAEKAEAKVAQLEAENVELRERWAAKAHELHTLKQERAEQATPEPRRASDMAIVAAIRRITRGGG
jgi:cell division protein FtsB